MKAKIEKKIPITNIIGLMYLTGKKKCSAPTSNEREKIP
jgi:hypothetical protein